MTHDSSTLRIGVVLDPLVVPAWAAKVIEDIRSSTPLELRLVVFGEKPSAPARRRSVVAALSDLLFRGYQWTDYRLFKASRDALALTDITRLRDDLSTVRCVAVSNRPGGRISDANLEQIRAAGLHLIVNLSPLELDERIAACAKYGVWSCHHGQPRAYSEMPPLMLEMYENNPVSETVLQCRTESHDAARILYRGSFATDRKSLYLNRNTSAWNSGEYLIRRLRDLARYGWAYIASLDTFNERDEYSKSTVQTPQIRTTIRFLGRTSHRFLGRRIHNLVFKEIWGIAYRARRGGCHPRPPFEGVRFLPQTEDRSYADPFLFHRDDKTYLFFEDTPRGMLKGVISYVVIDHLGGCTKPQTALQTDYHLSYPFLFEWQGNVYLLPDTSQNQTIELYRAVEFPHRWTRERVLMDNVRAADPTLLSFKGLFWLFLSMLSPSGALQQELSLFFAETPMGPWTPHPRNPIVADVRRARPAGRLFTSKEGLIRPGQDCSTRYGHAISFNLVEELTPSEYREREVGRLEPSWLPGAVGTHTFDRNERLEVIDFKIPVRRRAFPPSSRRHARDWPPAAHQGRESESWLDPIFDC